VAEILEKAIVNARDILEEVRQLELKKAEGVDTSAHRRRKRRRSVNGR
jgi:hypothetical protein